MTAALQLDTEDRAVPSDTYKSTEAEKSDKAALKKLATRLKVPDDWLRLDDCGCWHIEGPIGHIYAYSDSKRWLGGYLLVTGADDERGWSALKKKLGGTLRQDGDNGGVILLQPTEINVPTVRQALGCRR